MDRASWVRVNCPLIDRSVPSSHRSLRPYMPLTHTTAPGRPSYPLFRGTRCALARRFRPSCSCARPPPRSPAAGAGAPPRRSPPRPAAEDRVMFPNTSVSRSEASDASWAAADEIDWLICAYSCARWTYQQAKIDARTERPTATRGSSRRAVALMRWSFYIRPLLLRLVSTRAGSTMPCCACSSTGKAGRTLKLPLLSRGQDHARSLLQLPWVDTRCTSISSWTLDVG